MSINFGLDFRNEISQSANHIVDDLQIIRDNFLPLNGKPVFKLIILIHNPGSLGLINRYLGPQPRNLDFQIFSLRAELISAISHASDLLLYGIDFSI